MDRNEDVRRREVTLFCESVSQTRGFIRNNSQCPFESARSVVYKTEMTQAGLQHLHLYADCKYSYTANVDVSLYILCLLHICLSRRERERKRESPHLRLFLKAFLFSLTRLEGPRTEDVTTVQTDLQGQ